ncbi:sulfatase [Cellulophaga algicola DSM 14237]|uniref:Sulfatase n=1 Tax=Cellulophaga algicola (strain DSM 14237 / IC166 / ACAM 630) TaxID=688270 RepID=E6XEP0_CELAD|nr:sulfatase-like hydrolase/transferase [Cellulophaga algicola]ADV51368.1 sulfatase [Cellulophaga algicola DSM 14237]
MEVKVNILRKATLRGYTRLILAYLFCLVLLCVYQYVTLYGKGVTDQIFGVSFFLALIHHIGFSSLIALIFVLPYRLLEHVKPRLGIKFIFTILVLLLCVETLLIGYYTVAYVPLGSDILGYSIQSILNIIFKSDIFGMYVAGIFAVLIFTFYTFFKFTGSFYHYISKMFPFTIFLMSLFLMTLFTERKPINDNKTQYLAYNLISTSLDKTDYIAKTEFPLLKENVDKDVLGTYFNLKEEAPNFVFIIVEGLGEDFVGIDAEFGGFTPFIDELTQESLYFDHFLSNTGRTFGVIPSLLGSLPFGKNGFMNLKDMPNKVTLFSVLKNNGYHTNFYMGANSSFNHLDQFLRSENIDVLVDRSKYERIYKLQPTDAAGASWGYPDKELYKKAMAVYRPDSIPRLDVFMTLTTHEPFLLPNQGFYDAKVAAILETSNRYEKRTRKLIAKNKAIFSCLLYGDEALRDFMLAYKKKPSYSNTIFVITGDHRLVPIPQNNTLSRFHVPMLFYSPLLKEPKKISAVSSHLDVVPSILAMLSKKYNIKLPKKTSWLGSGLDMHAEFRSAKNIPLMRNKNELNDFIAKECFYSSGNLFSIRKNLVLEELDVDTRNYEVLLNNFKGLNAYVTKENKILPEEYAPYKVEKNKFTSEEIVWINSQFNGRDFDNAYETARQFAFDGRYDKALLLINFILSEVPSHIDAKILKGRVTAWSGAYKEASLILEECLETNPNYDDIYLAMLDIYFWSDTNEKVLFLYERIEDNNIKSKEVGKKVKRSYQIVQKKGKESNTLIVNANIEAYMASEI